MRTECSCQLCQAGCRTMPGYLIAEDLKHFDNEDLVNLRGSNGAVVMVEGNVMQLPTVVPAQQENGECVFYSNGRCDIHDKAPFGCRMFSTCDPDPGSELALDGVKSLLNSHLTGDKYAHLTSLLLPAVPRDRRVQAYRYLIECIEEHNEESNEMSVSTPPDITE